MNIKASDFIETAFSEEDAYRLDEAIAKGLSEGGVIDIDFTGIRFFTTLFFNLAICKYLVSLGDEEFNRLFVLHGLSDVGKSTYQHSLENARHFAGLSTEEQNTQMDITDQPEME